MFSKEHSLVTDKSKDEVLILLGGIFKPILLPKDNIIQGYFKENAFSGTISRHPIFLGLFRSNITITVINKNKCSEITTKVALNRIFVFFCYLTVSIVGLLFVISLTNGIFDFINLGLLIAISGVVYCSSLYLNQSNLEKAIQLIRNGIEGSD